jgi:phage FluMu protein Com
MIQISITQALVIYSMLLVGAGIVVWVMAETTVRRYHRILGKQDLWRCFFCGYSYLDESGEPISKCPRCESFNTLDDREAKIHVGGMIEYEDVPNAEQLQSARRNPSHRKRPHQRRRGPRRR